MSALARVAAWWRSRQHAAETRRLLGENCGPGVYLDPTVQVVGCTHVRIGHHTILSESCWLNVNHREPGRVGIIIGDNCFLGRRNFISAGALIEIGSYCLTGVDCHFLGADHVFASPFIPYLASGVTDGGEIRVGANCWLGASVTVLKGVSIGHGCVLGAGAVVTRSIPPFSIAVGNPARVVRRFDPGAAAWVPAAELSAAAEAALPGEEAYLAGLRERWPVVDGPRHASGWRMGPI
jgi:acetyltransferase-like isoleucine patch superfamily enzyme